MEDSCRITLTIHPMLRIVCVFERAVSRMKTSKYISDGVDKAESFIRFKQVWRAYAFQVNFMFKPFSHHPPDNTVITTHIMNGA